MKPRLGQKMPQQTSNTKNASRRTVWFCSGEQRNQPQTFGHEESTTMANAGSASASAATTNMYMAVRYEDGKRTP
jgi:hypothetical protein